MSESNQPRSIEGGRYIPELDGLRGIAILLVIVHHFAPKISDATARHLLHVGWIGVDLFFAISGFLITTILLNTCGKPRYFTNFYARRSLRIFPLYYVFLLIIFTVIPFVQGGPYNETEFIQESGSPWWYIFYCGNVREAMGYTEPQYFLAVTWSLCIEEHFYLVFPLLVALLSRRKLNSLLWGLVVASPIVRAIFLWAVPGNERIQYVATICRLDVLSLGCLLAIGLANSERFLSKSFAKWSCIASMSVLIAILADGLLDREQSFFRVFGYSIVALASASVVLVVLIYRETSQTLWLRTGPLANLGKLSYGVYLLQRPSEIALLKVLEKLHIDAAPDAIWLCLAKCAAAISIAWLSWTFFEQPILRLKRFFPTNGKTNPLESQPASPLHLQAVEA